MKVGKAFTRDVVTCSSLDSLEHAVRLMIERDIGCVVVIDQMDQVVGVVTDRDVVIASYRHVQRLRELPVTAGMSGPPIACRDDDDAEQVERVMREHRVRRVLVTDEHGLLVGILSLDDLARAAQAGELPAAEVAATLAAVAGR